MRTAGGRRQRIGLVLLAAIVANPAHGQTQSGAGKTGGAPSPSVLTCGALKAESTRTGTAAAIQWTISGPSGKTTESGVLRSGPRFQCIGGAVLVVEFTSTAGHSFFQAYFPDGTDVGYGRQQIDRRGGRFVLPVQAKARIADPYRAAFDYHCRLDMPADPISADARASCLF